MEENLEQLRERLAVVERELASSQTVAARRNATLERLVERIGTTRTPQREELERGKQAADADLAIRQRQRQDLLTQIEREQESRQVQEGPWSSSEPTREVERDLEL